MRSAEQFEYLREYIRRNGPAAGLQPGEYRHYLPKVVLSRREGRKRGRRSIRNGDSPRNG